LAKGRGGLDTPPSHGQFSKEVFVPQFEDGNLFYTLMEIVALSEFDRGWYVKELPENEFPTTTGPAAVSLTATDRIDAQNRPNTVAVQKDASNVFSEKLPSVTST
jgi:hypothetical protein